MNKKIYTEQEFVEYFSKMAEKCNITEAESVILYHNQRKTVSRLLKQVAEKFNMGFIEQDLTTLSEEKIGTSIFEDKVPKWLSPVFNEKDKKCFIIYMREFALANERIKNEAMNLLITKKIEGHKFPHNVIIILGVLDVDGITSGITNVDSVVFYKNID